MQPIIPHNFRTLRADLPAALLMLRFSGPSHVGIDGRRRVFTSEQHLSRCLCLQRSSTQPTMRRRSAGRSTASIVIQKAGRRGAGASAARGGRDPAPASGSAWLADVHFLFYLAGMAPPQRFYRLWCGRKRYTHWMPDEASIWRAALHHGLAFEDDYGMAGLGPLTRIEVGERVRPRAKTVTIGWRG